MKKVIGYFIGIVGLSFFLTVFSSVYAATTVVKMYLLTPEGIGKFIGNVTFTDTQYGLLIAPQLTGLPAGLHGFHMHENPNCADNGMAAGGHYDPQKTGKHMGPYSSYGHAGDLPVLYVDAGGSATVQTMAPRLMVKDLFGHAFIIHANGDNYSDVPEKMGGGGGRIACGVLAAQTLPTSH